MAVRLKSMEYTRRRGGYGIWPVLLPLLGLMACATEPARQPPPTTGPAPPAQIYFYPNRGQTAAQQDRDRYECYLWAVRQSGFEPSATPLAPHQQLEVTPIPPPGHDTAVGAVTGAVIGAAVAPPNKRPEGALVGAIAGGLLGAASDAAREEQAGQVRADLAQRAGTVERQARNYRRAMTACLEARGYTVR